MTGNVRWDSKEGQPQHSGKAPALASNVTFSNLTGMLRKPTDEYSKVKADVNFPEVNFPKEVAEKVGLGFNLDSEMFPVVPQFSEQSLCKAFKIKLRALSSVG